MSVWWWICSSDPKISTFPHGTPFITLDPEKSLETQGDGVGWWCQIDRCQWYPKPRQVFFCLFLQKFLKRFLGWGVFFFIGWKVRQSFPLTVISRVTTLFIGVISPVNQYQVVWLPFLLGFFQKSHDSYIPRVFAFLWVDLFFWFGKKAAFNVQMMQVRHVVFQKVIDMPPAFGQHFCVWFQTLSMATFIFIYIHIPYIYIYEYICVYIYIWIFAMLVLAISLEYFASVFSKIFAPFGDLWPKDCSTDGLFFAGARWVCICNG